MLVKHARIFNVWYCKHGLNLTRDRLLKLIGNIEWQQYCLKLYMHIFEIKNDKNHIWYFVKLLLFNWAGASWNRPKGIVVRVT